MANAIIEGKQGESLESDTDVEQEAPAEENNSIEEVVASEEE